MLEASPSPTAYFGMAFVMKLAKKRAATKAKLAKAMKAAKGMTSMKAMKGMRGRKKPLPKTTYVADPKGLKKNPNRKPESVLEETAMWITQAENGLVDDSDEDDDEEEEEEEVEDPPKGNAGSNAKAKANAKALAKKPAGVIRTVKKMKQERGVTELERHGGDRTGQRRDPLKASSSPVVTEVVCSHACLAVYTYVSSRCHESLHAQSPLNTWPVMSCLHARSVGLTHAQSPSCFMHGTPLM